jgi:alpha-2-macroglobulin
MVVAVSDGRYFGTSEANLTARLPLMVRPSAPRFLNFGDQLELPVVVQNQTDAPMTVDMAMQTSNLALTGAAGVRVTVPAQDRVEVRFPATTMRPGTARFQVAAVSGPYADAAAG